MSNATPTRSAGNDASRSLLSAGILFKSKRVSPTVGRKGGWAVYFIDLDGVTLEMIQRADPASPG